MPIRIQRKRTRGWKMPENTVYVGRGSQWGNPFIIGKDGSIEQVLKKYTDWLFPYTHHGNGSSLDNFYMSEANLSHIKLLRGKNLACWCSLDDKCHADILLTIANEE